MMRKELGSSLGIRTIRLPTTPRLRQVLQNRLRLVLLDRLWHHVKNVVHNRGTQLEIIMRLDTLFRDSLRNTFAVSAFELTSK